MKTFLIIGGLIFGWWILTANNSSTPSYSYSDYEYEESTMDRYDALYDYWDDIKEEIDWSYDLVACSDSSGNCYDLTADISSGEVDTLYFPNGGYISIYGADFDSDGDASGYDDEDNYWTFEISEGVIDDALDDWAYYNDIELE